MEGDLTELTSTGKKKQRRVFLFNDIIICTSMQKARFVYSEKEKANYEFRWSVSLREAQIGSVERVKGFQSSSFNNGLFSFYNMQRFHILRRRRTVWHWNFTWQ